MHLHLTLLPIPTEVKNGENILTLRSFIPHIKKNEESRKFDYWEIEDPWIDRKSLAIDYRLVHDLYDEKISEITKYLNELHNKDFDSKFWKIFLGSSLLNILMSLIIKVRILQSASNKYNIETISILDNEKLYLEYHTDKDYFSRHRFDEYWNFAQYSILLRSLFKKQPAFNCQVDTKAKDQTKSSIIKPSWRRRLLFALARLSSKIQPNSVLFYATHFSKSDLIKLQVALKQLPILLPEFSLELKSKKRDRKYPPNNTCKFRYFEDIEASLQMLLIELLPVYSIEGFNELSKIVQREQRLPKSSKSIITSTGLWFDTYFKAVIAFRTISGSHAPIIFQLQHCGSAGITQHNLMDYEEELGDFYVTWGHIREFSKNLIGYGPIKDFTNISNWRPESKDIVIIRSWNPHHFQKLSTDIGLDERSITQCDIFIDRLERVISEKHILLRLYPYKKAFGGNVQDIFQETLYWKNKYPKIRQDSSSQIKAIYETSRLIVYTYIQGTGYVECLALNRPIIILAPNVESAFKPEFRPFVKRMQKIGMIFDNAEAAAAHVNAVYCKIEDWWLSVEVQSVIRDFQEHYVKMDHSPKRFAKVLEKIAMENSKW